MILKRIILCISIIALFASMLNAAPKPDDLVFFVNKESVSAASISLKELEQIFLSKLTEWPDKKSGAIVPYNMALDTPERTALAKLVLSKSADDEKKYWVQKRIEGKENPPDSKKTAIMVQMMTSNMKGAVGYCFFKDFKDNPKLSLIKIDGKEGLSE